MTAMPYALARRALIATAGLTLAAGCSSFGAADATGPSDAAASDAADASVPCGNAGELSYSGHCYFLVAADIRVRASAACRATGAHLVTIGSKAESDFLLTTLIQKEDVWCGLLADPGTNERATFKWDTMEPVVYMSWEPTNPNEGSGCVAIESTGVWGDKACSATFRGLCERE